MTRDTLIDRFFDCETKYAALPALYYSDGGNWKHYTWAQYVRRARAFAGALIELGLQAGDGVAIMSDNNPEWVIADVGAMIARGVPTGIYQTCTAEQAEYIANHCEAKVVVLESRERWEYLGGAAWADTLEHTDKIVLIRDAEQVDDPRVMSFADFEALGAANQSAVDDRAAQIEEDDLAMLIYTSGTTGPPKGVMLSHRNIAWTTKQAFEMVGDGGPDDAIVSYLPLSHIAEQLFSILVPVTGGIPIWFAEDLTKVKDAMLAARPTFFLAVPRVWEKFKAAMEGPLSEATGVKKFIVDNSRAALLEGGRVVVERGEQALPFGLKVRYDLANKLFGTKLKEKLGLERLKLAVTGAAPISFEVLEFFLSIGIIIHEGYGQSEGVGAASYNQPHPGQRKLGSAGKPFPGLEMKIAEDGEILVRGPNVFLGYYKDPDATAATVIDGWLHSGDVGELDSDGYLKITDRKKDLIITAGGKNVAPQNIEKFLRSIEGVGNAVAIGDRQRFIAALVTVCPDQAPGLAVRNGWPTERSELAIHPAFRAYLQAQIDSAVNTKLARYESVREFRVIAEDFTVEGGELTPTQKVKRPIVNQKYAHVIEEIYA